MEAMSRFVPTVSWLRYILPERFQHPIAQAAAALSGKNDASMVTNSYTITSTQSAEGSNLSTFAFSPTSSGTISSFLGEKGDVKVEATAGSSKASGSYYSANDLKPSDSSQQLLPFQQQVLSSMLMDHAIGQHVCILGPKGSGKSVITREFSRAVGYEKLRVFPLYQELTSRDLLQRRVTDDAGSTTWTDSPLIRSAREGGLCVLDGIQSLD